MINTFRGVKMGTLYCFRFFDGRVEFVRDGGMGSGWIVEFAQKYFNIIDIWQVSSVNGIYSADEFFAANQIN